MKILVNGTQRETDPDTTVAMLLKALGLDPARVAVERNRSIVRRAEFASTSLSENDRLEIVQFVGGG